MVEKKRSLGVIVFAIIFILIGGSLALFFFKDLLSGAYSVKNIYLRDFIFIGSCLTITATGIGLLSLKSWARRLTLYVIPVFVFYFFFGLARFYGLRGVVSCIKTPIGASPPTGLHSDILFLICDLKHMVTNIGSWIFILFGLGIIWLIIFSFTRPKVKALFSPPKPKD